MASMERLNKLLAHAGVGSRRHCEDLITAGRVTVDGRVVRELGTRVAPEQRLAVPPGAEAGVGQEFVEPFHTGALYGKRGAGAAAGGRGLGFQS